MVKEEEEKKELKESQDLLLGHPHDWPFLGLLEWTGPSEPWLASVRKKDPQGIHCGSGKHDEK